MKIAKNVLKLIGHTPMVQINRLNPNNKVNIWAKLEYLNPSGSIKDRIGKYMIEAAEESGELKEGGTIVENTSGNTGLGISLTAAVKGYKAILTMPDKTSWEKINFLKAYGAETVITPTSVPATDPKSYYETAKRIAKETKNSFYPNQYDNPKNVEAHYKSTGPEIWKQTDGKIDYFVAGIGTGGTLSGVAQFLKEKKKDIKIIAVDPIGSVFYEFYKTGIPGEFKPYKVEGIGESKITKALDFEIIDEIIRVEDKPSFLTARELAKKEGIFAGGSSGAIMWVAQQLAKREKNKANIVIIFPDSGDRYVSKIYNNEWMRENKFL